MVLGWQGIWAQYMVCDHIRDPVIIVFPGPAAEKTVIATVVDTKGCAFNRVPVINSAVHRTLGFEKLPVGMGPDYNPRLTGQRKHIQHAVHDNAGPNAIRIIECQKVL